MVTLDHARQITVRQGHGAQLVQDRELEVQFDTIHRRFENRLDLIQIGVFGGQQAEIKKDDKDIDRDQVAHYAARLLFIEIGLRLENAPSFP